MRTENNVIKLYWWALVLFFLNAFYLLAELVFNAKLLNTASTLNIDTDALYSVELFGRSVSGVGFALFAVGIMRWLSDKPQKWQRVAGVLFVIVSATLFL